MFKFMKSKKGFTLVELMIVVVIMAILVAVAVPIYSAVTANARKKTCIGNQRNIVSQVNNQVMSGGAVFKIAKDATGTIEITTNATGDAVSGTITDNVFDATKGSSFDAMFSAKNKPFCPVENGKIKVEITNKGDGSCTVVTTCETTGDLGHVLGA